MSNGMRSTELAVVVDSSHNLDGQVIEEQISSADKITYESGSASLKYVFDCWPPHGIVGRCLTWTLLVLLGWGAAIAIIGISDDRGNTESKAGTSEFLVNSRSFL